MATFYLDYEGGNDAADGTSFANRWKTITGGATAARIAPGDTIRVMKSPDPTSLGINATWTNKSVTITLASALNALITNCDSAWTASANVTCATDSFTAARTPGAFPATSVKHSIAAGFTTGLAAYFALGSAQNYSAYQGITLWVYVSAALAASTLSIRLCSDTAGATTVDTLPLPAISQASQWVPVYIDKGSALGASIQSIALYADLDPGTIDVYFDNISTTKAAGNDCLNLQTLIGKNTGGDETWWALREIDGTTLKIDNAPSISVFSLASIRGYSGTTETVTTYIRKTIPTDLITTGSPSTSVASVQDSGTSGNLITFEGGYDRTNMSTLDGETWWDGRTGFGTGIDFNGKNYVKFDNIHLVRYDQGYLVGSSTGNQFGTVTGNHCKNAGIAFGSSAINVTVGTAKACGNGTDGFQNVGGSGLRATLLIAHSNGISTNSGWSPNGGSDFIITTLKCHNNGWYGFFPQGVSMVKITTLSLRDNAQIGFNSSGTCASWFVDSMTCNGQTNYGMSIVASLIDWRIGTLTCQSNGTGVNLSPSTVIDMVINSLVTSSNTSAGVTTGVLHGSCVVLSSSLTDTTPLSGTSAGVSAGRLGRGFLSFQNYNGASGDHRTYVSSVHATSGGLIQAVADADRHTLSGLAWKFSPRNTDWITSDWPMRWPMAKIACNAALTTVKIWVKRDNTGVTAKLVCKGGQISGVANDVVATASAGAGTYEELTITFTPSVVGVVEIEVQVYGGTTYNVWFDDMTVS